MKKLINILHTDASPGWGGQEMRILKEAIGMRARGYRIIFALQKGGGLASHAKQEGFVVYELCYSKSRVFQVLYRLLHILVSEKIDLINTHSSLDAWLGGFTAKLLRKKVIRTRHLSTPIHGGLNRFLLYRCLADTVVTTCEKTAQTLRTNMSFSKSRCVSIPTGVDTQHIAFEASKVEAFRHCLGLKEGDCLVGTLCVLRGWKGISDLLAAAKELEGLSSVKWLIIGGGVGETYFRNQWKELNLEKKVFFTGHLDYPFVPLAALDIFMLLSWANEGVSQASLQAGWLKKPLITTSVGGLPEVCIDGKTGFIVPPHNASAVATAVKKLVSDHILRREMGEKAHELVRKNFLFPTTLDSMENVYKLLLGKL